MSVYDEYTALHLGQHCRGAGREGTPQVRLDDGANAEQRRGLWQLPAVDLGAIPATGNAHHLLEQVPVSTVRQTPGRCNYNQQFMV